MLTLFDQDLRGHRLGYLTFVASAFGDATSEILCEKNWKTWLRLVKSDQVFLSSADNYTVFALFVGVCRKLLGKQTAALFIAAERLGFHASVVSGLKRSLLRLAKSIGCLDAAAITPFEFAPNLANLCNSWVYDLQFLAPNLDQEPNPSLASSEQAFINNCRARVQRGGSLILLLGGLGVTRGFGDFIRTAVGTPLAGTDLTFVAAGNADHAARELLSDSDAPTLLSLPQCIGAAGFDELLQLADMVWCYFPPAYDQNSGVFCNAVRSGKPVLIRRDSFLHRLGVSHIKMTSAGWPGKPFPEDSLLLSPSASSREFTVECARRVHDVLSRLIPAEGQGR